MGATGRDGMQGETWREPKGVGDTQRDRHEGWMQRQVKRLKEPSHGKRDKEKDRRQIDRSVGRETERHRDMGGDSYKVIATETFP